VVCVKWGTKYGAEYVNKLFNGVKRNLAPLNFMFYCFTDDATGLDKDVTVKPLPTGWKHWWNKAALFADESGLT
jgi:hypothetical protein